MELAQLCGMPDRGANVPGTLFDESRFRLLPGSVWWAKRRTPGVMVECRRRRLTLLDGVAFNIDTTCWPDSGVREVNLI